MRINVSQEHIDRALSGEEDPITISPREQVGRDWVWLGANDIRNLTKPVDETVRVKPLTSDNPAYNGKSTYLHNVMHAWSHNPRDLKPFYFEADIERDGDMSHRGFFEIDVRLRSGERLQVRAETSTVLSFTTAPETVKAGFFVSADPDGDNANREILVELGAKVMGTDASKLSTNITPAQITVPAGGEARFELEVTLNEPFDDSTTKVRVFGNEPV